MAKGNIGPSGEKNPERPPKILTKPLPQILDEMEANIRAAAEAAWRADEAARRAGTAAGDATKASGENVASYLRGYLDNPEDANEATGFVAAWADGLDAEEW